MPILTPDDVRKIALLARLEMTEDEVATYAGQLDGILGHLAELQALDTADVPPTSHSVGGKNVTRADEPRASLEPDDVVAGGPNVEGHFFVVPQIVDV